MTRCEYPYSLSYLDERETTIDRADEREMNAPRDQFDEIVAQGDTGLGIEDG